ncbi:FAD-dependent oxidoreductase [Vibrio sp. 99-8-1]|uniref:FAD-dependent oxidoreductase n=1 Tax=Vibrio sp. 99-8-1 TaxID=2607602 RepID=UPI0014939D5E|nr:FAD-dependent oxidoreductase [Vibrio sp. 99-8-1]NOI68580.1 FAD-dependent oxidoreductase [Vibrio sp. 99-8-1]
MDKYIEPHKEIDILATTEVLVVGGGPAGLSAAIAAAREGVKVLLIERFGCFGGMMTTAGVESIAWWRHEKTVDAGGLAREFENEAQKMGATSPEPQSVSQAINAELFKVVADKMVDDAGVNRLLHIFAVDVIKEDGTVKGVVTESKSGRKAILADRVIDCSGDADIAMFSGAPFTQPDKSEVMSVTTVFNCSNIDKQRFMDDIRASNPTYNDWGKDEDNKNWSYEIDKSCQKMFSPYLGKVFAKAKKEGLVPDGVTLGGSWSTITDYGDANYMNVQSLANIDCTNVFDLTTAEIEGRKQALCAIEALRKMQPGFENARLKNFGMTVGTRESRHIVGSTRLNENDIVNQGRHPDTIGIFPEFIDGNGMLKLPLEPRYFQIPYGALLPTGVENLLVCGRAIDSDPFAHATTRNMACCAVTGQGAGVAAAISIKQKTTCRNVDIHIVQSALEKQGVKVF